MHARVQVREGVCERKAIGCVCLVEGGGGGCGGRLCQEDAMCVCANDRCGDVECRYTLVTSGLARFLIPLALVPKGNALPVLNVVLPSRSSRQEPFTQYRCAVKRSMMSSRACQRIFRCICSHCVAGVSLRGCHPADSLPWEPRYRVAVQLAGALQYLHEGAPRPVLHRNVRSAMVLLRADHSCVVSEGRG